MAPELLRDNQVAWGMNINVRGGKPGTRPNLASRLILPPGLIQGGEFFGVQGGMIVVSIAGRLWRLRINGNSFSYENIPLGFDNSGIIKQVWMTQTVETLVIQDGQSNAILYNGSVANRAVVGQVPRGRQMAYGNGRLWVAVDANEALAGDIRTTAAGSELNFTEATYLQGGGKLFFTSPITAMAFIPVTGQSDYGALLVFGSRESNAIRADITARDDWGKIPGFVTALLRSVGAAGQWNIVAVNQDLYWRDSNGGIRSIRNALADEAGPGSAPISREVSRLVDYDSQQLLPFCSGVYFDNRMLVTSSPYLMPNGGVGWKNVIPLDFAPLSTMGGKSQPAYDGKWNGLNFVKLVGGVFRGKNRAFALTTDDDGINELWEFGTGDRADLISNCSDGTSDGTADPALMENPIRCFIEYPRRNFGEPKRRKDLKRCDVYLSDVDGEIDLTVYWRADNSQKWLKWDEASTCAKTTDPAGPTPHVWKNLVAQYRPQFKTFTIPDDIQEVIKYSAQVGFEFQIRLEWTGKCRIHRMMLMADLLSDPDYADREGFSETCVQENVSGNEIEYVLRTNCNDCVATFDVQPEDATAPAGSDTSFSVTVATTSEELVYQWQFSSNDGASWQDLSNGRHIAGATSATLQLIDILDSWDGNLYRCLLIIPGCGPEAFPGPAIAGKRVISNEAGLSFAALPSVFSECVTTGFDYFVPAFVNAWPNTARITGAIQTINEDGSFSFVGTANLAANNGCQLRFIRSSSDTVTGGDEICFSSAIGGAAPYSGPITGSGQIDCFVNPNYSKPHIWATYFASDDNGLETQNLYLGEISRTAFSGAECIESKAFPWGCGATARDSQVRGNCSNLTIGQTYLVTFHFVSTMSDTEDRTIEFLATGESQLTDYIDFPDADEIVGNWSILSVEIEDITECPAITAQPTNQFASDGGSATFSVTATMDVGSPTYQWQRNTGSGWNNMLFQVNPTLVIDPVSLSMNGYQYRCVVSGVACDVISDPATLTVTP